MDDLIALRQGKKEGFHVGKGDKVKAFFMDKALDALDILDSVLSFKDDVAEAKLEEIRFYKNDQYIADQIRTSLERELKDAWDNNKKVALISHSMGTFVAYDVLWRFSHREVPGYAEYRGNKVDLFITMGSPLGDNVVQDLLFGKRYKKDDRKFYPNNVNYWHNYACLGDIVSHDSTLKDDFFEELDSLKLVKEEKTRDYEELYNPYVTTKGKKNPHKSYGYLVQPKLAKWLIKFLKDEL